MYNIIHLKEKIFKHREKVKLFGETEKLTTPPPPPKYVSNRSKNQTEKKKI